MVVHAGASAWVGSFYAVIAGSPKAGLPHRTGVARQQLARRLLARRAFTFWPSKRPRTTAMKRTFQPSKIRRARTHGFLVRMKSRGGRKVINSRRAKGRKRLAA